MNILKGTKLEGTRVDQDNTPKFWKIVRNWSLLVGAITAYIITGGDVMPEALVTVAEIVAPIAGGLAAFALTRKEKKDV